MIIDSTMPYMIEIAELMCVNPIVIENIAIFAIRPAFSAIQLIFKFQRQMTIN